MKKYLFLNLLALLFGFSAAIAQEGGGGGGFQRMTPEERVKNAMEQLKPLNLSEDQSKKTSDTLLVLFKEQQKFMEDMRASGSFDREAMQAKRKELAAKRDEKLKNIFTAEQMKKFKEEIEPNMQPQRRPQ